MPEIDPDSIDRAKGNRAGRLISAEVCETTAILYRG